MLFPQKIKGILGRTFHIRLIAGKDRAQEITPGHQLVNRPILFPMETNFPFSIKEKTKYILLSRNIYIQFEGFGLFQIQESNVFVYNPTLLFTTATWNVKIVIK